MDYSPYKALDHGGGRLWGQGPLVIKYPLGFKK